MDRTRKARYRNDDFMTTRIRGTEIQVHIDTQLFEARIEVCGQKRKALDGA